MRRLRVICDRRVDPLFQLLRRTVDDQTDLCLDRPVEPFDLVLGLGMIGRAKDMGHAVGIQVFGQEVRREAGTVVR